MRFVTRRIPRQESKTCFPIEQPQRGDGDHDSVGPVLKAIAGISP